MLFITLVSLFGFILITKTSDLQKYVDLIDINNDGKLFSDEILLFFNKFYEEKQDQLSISSLSSIKKQKDILHNVIKRYNYNSSANYLTLLDLKQLFFDLYSLQNQIPTFLFNNLEPEQVHLSYTHDVFTEMYISFVTRKRPSSNLRPIVKYCDHECIAIGDTTTYNVDNWHYWIHFIYIKGLEPGVKYNYKLGFIDSDNVTIKHLYSNEIWTFKTMAQIAKQEKEIVYIYGDMGTIMPLGFDVMKSIIKDFNTHKDEQANYVVHVGDIAYAGTGHEKEIQTIWDLFMNQISPISSQIPYMTATGNHEKYYNYTSYKTRFFMPSKTKPTSLEIDGNFYFSLETNLVQWIFLSTEHNYTNGSSQRKFLEYILQQYEQKWKMKERPWLILVGHRPMYSSDQATDSGNLQSELEPLIIKYGVDLAIWGHMHCYERTTPVKYNNFTDKDHFSSDGKIYKHNATEFNQTSPIHLTIGTAGALVHENWIPKPEWSQTRYQKYGFGKLFIHNKTHLEFKSILTDKTSSDDEDYFMIIRQF
ncbi:unnamed protein product [Rotaria sordida]|uniref:Purple acid phosphatase n=2 Tax=Rotaria sordida TaxID=392033 RepID=A0A815CFU6_9BILA|nr:unnamed protein product [Rotaria sordida]CAF1283064.1 unnamed protein product [Rotaria sordida]CAF3612639.1 unnamed protein product [Rotaria sordida]CAF3673402.1 unnamed protein product [Rotaria sordida]